MEGYLKYPFLDNHVEEIIIPLLLRWCWNWQTGMVEGHVPQGVGVQVPPSACKGRHLVTFFAIFSHITSIFLEKYKFLASAYSKNNIIFKVDIEK